MSVSIVTRLRAGRPGFDSRYGKVHTGSGSHPASCSMGTGVVSSGLKRTGRES
jgi:hypothetical protein